MKPQPLIAVKDVPASSRWYQKLLGCISGHGGDEYEQLIDPATGEMILQLHHWVITIIPIWAIPMRRPTAMAFCCGFTPTLSMR